MRRARRSVAILTVPVTVLLWTALQVSAQSGAKNGEWTTYGGDLGHTRYSRLEQISSGNYSGELLAFRLP